MLCPRMGSPIEDVMKQFDELLQEGTFCGVLIGFRDIKGSGQASFSLNGKRANSNIIHC